MNKIKCIEFSYGNGTINKEYYQSILKFYGELLTDNFSIACNPILDVGTYVIFYENGETQEEDIWGWN